MSVRSLLSKHKSDIKRVLSKSPIGRTNASLEQAGIISAKCGYLYNWYAVMDVENIANDGWRVPSETDFETLSTYLGGDAVAGGKLKEIGTVYWASPNTGATNESRFNVWGCNYRFHDGTWSGNYGWDKYFGEFWTVSECEGVHVTGVIVLQLIYLDATFELICTEGNKSAGFSIRLLKNSTILDHGETSTYIGNDGKIYNTICIGTQEWISGNLAETKYRNGDDIPEVTSNAEWAALVTSARCSYHNIPI